MRSSTAADKLRDAIRARGRQSWAAPRRDRDRRRHGVRARTDVAAAAEPSPDFGGGTYASNKRTYSYGAHAAHVAVDAKTGQVEVIDYVAVEDVGRIINPLTLHGQCVGAIVQGLGGALLEHFVYDEDGQLLTGSFADYLMPTASDFPSIRAIALEEKPLPTNPLGAKGAGEGGIIPVGGVIANAVADALGSLGVEPREFPLSPPRVWQLIQDAEHSALTGSGDPMLADRTRFSRHALQSEGTSAHEIAAVRICLSRQRSPKRSRCSPRVTAKPRRSPAGRASCR